MTELCNNCGHETCLFHGEDKRPAYQGDDYYTACWFPAGMSKNDYWTMKIQGESND